jgi:hypothetical protein
MTRYAIMALLGLALTATMACHQNEVRLPRTPRGAEFVWREPVDPEQYLQKTQALKLALEPPTGYAEARERAPDEFVMATHLDWNAMADELQKEFLRLVGLHNNAEVSLQQYEQGISELERILQHMQSTRADIVQTLSQYRKLRDEWHSLRWSTEEKAANRRQEVRDQFRSIRASVAEQLQQARRMIDQVQGTRPAPDIMVKR